MLLPAVTVNCKSTQNKSLLSKSQNNGTTTKILASSNPLSDKGKTDRQKIEQMGNKSRLPKSSVRPVTAGSLRTKTSVLAAIGRTSGVAVAAGRLNPPLKKNEESNDNLSCTADQPLKPAPISATNQPSSSFGSVRGVTACIGSAVSHDVVPKPKDYSTKKFASEIQSKMKNYQIQSDYKETAMTSQNYKPRSSTAINNLSTRFVNQSTVRSTLQREPTACSSVHQQSRPASRNENTAFAVARKALEQQNPAAKMTPINFPPLRAPQSIVNVRHPFVTEARTKHNEIGGPSGKSKLNTASSLQTGIKDLDHNRQTFHSYGAASQIAGVPNVPSLSNVTANISPYPRPETFPQPTVASVLFPDTAQFPQSPPFSTTQIGQLNQYQTYDPGSFATTPVNVNQVIPQFSAENSIPYPQYDNPPPQFVQPNHYPTADMANSQYQYQAAGVSQIQDSPMFIQSLQSPIAVTDQYAPPNYARAVRTELIPRLRRASRFNK